MLDPAYTGVCPVQTVPARRQHVITAVSRRFAWSRVHGGPPQAAASLRVARTLAPMSVSMASRPGSLTRRSESGMRRMRGDLKSKTFAGVLRCGQVVDEDDNMIQAKIGQPLAGHRHVPRHPLRCQPSSPSLLKLHCHAIANFSHTRPSSRLSVDHRQAIVADTHATKETSKIIPPSRASKGDMSFCHQSGRNRFPRRLC
jgi:hypothetical protein